MKAHERGPAAARRRNMIERLGAGGICDPRVLEAMAAIPRHIFVDPALADRAYDDYAAPIGEGQTISKPYTVAMMTQLAGLTGTERALEVGTGSGYQTSVLSLLAGSVVTVERLKSLSNRARKIFNELHLTNIVCLVGDGSVGAAKYAPFDVIIVTAGAPEIPEPLARQLVDGGRMIVPVGKGGEQKIALVRRSGERFKVEMKEGCKFVPLLGESGFKQKPARG
ncbi:MAG: protein-L-isoaspartate(D-aspartate) O-methyltransferase [Nitrospinae bacterium]|nr:protein-L-isoaspartate(D-aspartate) O-methyltransferase [Nitrospinota bacterium]